MESNSLLERLQWLQSADPVSTYKPLHSERRTVNFDYPHSCAHCQHISIDVEEFAEKPLVDLGEGRAYRQTSFSREIGRGLEQAIAASKAGCALYEWVLDTLTDNLRAITPTGDSVDRIIFNLEFETDDEISCAPVIDGLFKDGRNFRPQSNSASGSLWSRLDVCVRRDDPASNIISQHPPESDMFSERSIRFGKDCLATCLKYHEQCRTEWLRADLNRLSQNRHPLETIKLQDETISLDDLPTRLLRIEAYTDKALLVRLVEIPKLTTKEQEQVAAAGFAALSYCWGKEGNPIQLKSETCKGLKQGIAVSMLPATISDAIQFSKELSLEYIWVDALCIFQDDDQDKEIEIRRMGAYYGANTLTLCAASADGSSKGLRNPDASSPYPVPPLGLACRIGESMGQLILHSKSDVRESITERGWTLQESLLSRRILIFSHQLYWCCVSANAECEGPLARLSKEPNRNFGLPESLVPGIFPAQVLRDYPPDSQWHLGVSDFVKRRLGVASDKLLAISAFASWVDARYRACAEAIGADYSYVAGLFVSTQDTESLVKQLLWRPLKTSHCTRPLTYRAPSWSWAAVDGELKLREEPPGSSCHFDGFDLQLAHTAAPYGNVERAALRLSGCRVRLLQDCRKFLVHIEDDANVPNEDGVCLLPDTPQDGHTIRAALDASASSSLYLCQLSEAEMHSGHWSGSRRYSGCVGLIITPVLDEAASHFRRVGSFDFYRNVIYQNIQLDETERDRQFDRFFDVEGQNIILL